jgi:predicted GNAT family acetyltransferase
MIIQQRKEGNNGTFYIEDKGEVIAEMTYRKDKDKMVIDHTEVDESLRGRNVGFELVERGVEYAREAHLRIVPICKFAKSVIKRTEKFQDVL